MTIAKLNVPKPLARKSDEIVKSIRDIPRWMRLASGVLGLLTSFLLVGLPAIVLVIIDRVIPSSNQHALWSLFFLGTSTIVAVSLIEIMRMKALENYIVNVRGVIFFQDSCFALFWALVIGFIHPALSLPSILGALYLFVFWKFRKPLTRKVITENDLPDFEAEKISACGLGPAFSEMASQGKFPAFQRLDFQTISQWFTIGLLKRLTFIGVLVLSSWLHMNGLISLGTAVGALFLNQMNIEVFTRCFQVASLRTPRHDVAQLDEIIKTRYQNNKPVVVDSGGILTINCINGAGFSSFSADIFSGLCLTFIGPSGCGKSRILEAIATGCFDKGTVTLDKVSWDKLCLGGNAVGYVPASPINLPGTIVDNVTGYDPMAQKARAIELIRQLDPYEDVFKDENLFEDTLKNNFSPQGQIVSIARAFYIDAPVLIIDSPELFLDKASKAALLALILKAKTDGKIVLLATDDDYLMTAADEVVKLDRGEVTDRGPMAEVLARHHERWVRVSFEPTKRDAFRLALWLDSQLNIGLSAEMVSRIKQTAVDMLFLAPRDTLGGLEDSSIFDLKVGRDYAMISMHDRGDLLEMEDANLLDVEVQRIVSDTDGFTQKLQEGFRQITVTFTDRENIRSMPVAIGA